VAAHLTLYVAETGNDGNDGTEESPFGKVATALQAIKDAYASDWPGGGKPQGRPRPGSLSAGILPPRPEPTAWLK
jgi:hypothetical protein